MAANRDALRVEGLTELVQACDAMADLLPVDLRTQLKGRVGEPVAREARRLFASADLASPSTSRAKTAAGIQPQVTKQGEVLVIQTLRKSRRPARRRHNYGRLQLEHGFFPALDNTEAMTVRNVGAIVDETLRHW